MGARARRCRARSTRDARQPPLPARRRAAAGDPRDPAPRRSRAVRRAARRRAGAASARGARPARRSAPRPLVLCAKGHRGRARGRCSPRSPPPCCPGWPVAVLSGPTFAAEVAAGLPTAVTLACADAALGHRARRAARPARPSAPIPVADVVGAGSAGRSRTCWRSPRRRRRARRSARMPAPRVITRGFAEMRRYGAALGARAGDAGRPVGARRSRPDLHRAGVAQLRARRRARRGAERGRGARRERRRRRGRGDRADPRGERGGARHRPADGRRRRRPRRRRGERRRRHRPPARPPAPPRGVTARSRRCAVPVPRPFRAGPAPRAQACRGVLTGNQKSTATPRRSQSP